MIDWKIYCHIVTGSCNAEEADLRAPAELTQFAVRHGIVSD